MDEQSRKEEDGVTNAFGLWRYGNDYFNAAFTLHKHHAESAFTPFYATVGQSIELSLKAFLVASGVEVQDVRKKFGHRLIDLLKESKGKGLEKVVKLEDSHWGMIDLMSKEYSGKRYHYIETGRLMLPHSEGILHAAQTLTVGLQDYCTKNTEWKFQ